MLPRASERGLIDTLYPNHYKVVKQEWSMEHTFFVPRIG